MTDLKFKILKTLYEKYPIREESQSVFLTPQFADPVLVKCALSELEVKGYIEPVLGSDKYRLTPLGSNAFEDAQEERNKNAKNERQQRFDNKVSVASVLIPTVTFFLGLVVERSTQVVDFVISLFK